MKQKQNVSKFTLNWKNKASCTIVLQALQLLQGASSYSKAPAIISTSSRNSQIATRCNALYRDVKLQLSCITQL
jgi:hypothetical protein